MKSITVRDLRQRWPEAEAALQLEKELVITRSGKPVVRLIRYEDAPVRRKRFDPRAHAKWQRKVSNGRIVRWVDDLLAADRSER